MGLSYHSRQDKKKSESNFCLIFFFVFQKKHGVTGNGSSLGKQYMSFVRGNMDQVAKKISDDLWVLGVMEVS